MKVVIFAGGKGSRLSEATTTVPKPMVEIGGMPMVWHIMKLFSHYGHNEFVICLGYKGGVIKEWFSNYFLRQSDITIDLSTDRVTTHRKHGEDWKVTLIDTGLEANTATRLLRVRPFLEGIDFLLTYGDGLSDIDINTLISFHRSHQKIATVTAIQPEYRFGSLELGEGGVVTRFSEKLDHRNTWVNGGFFVLKSAVFNYLSGEKDEMWERGPLERLARDGQLVSYSYRGFWKSMDILRDKMQFEELWSSPRPPWKAWTN